MARLSKKKVSEAINKYLGNVTKVAEACGVSRTAIYKFLDKYPEMKDELAEAREVLLDNVENKGYEIAMRGDGNMIRFFLGRLGKHRGYVERMEQEVSGKDGGDVVIRYVNDWRNPTSDSS